MKILIKPTTFVGRYWQLVPLLLFTALLLAGRVLHSHSLTLVFIPWNLFLAILPLYFSYRLDYGHKFFKWVWLIAWLAFFPNAMYIITDLFHLKKMRTIPEWYDLLILFSSAVTGVLIGYLSLFNVERFLARLMDRRIVTSIIGAFFLLCGYGIYLGRYLRWNSWDIVADPFALLDDVKEEVFHPFHNKECWLLTLLFGVWMQLMYHYFKKLKLS